MKHLYFCRHGESFINVQNVFATKLGAKNDLGLTELGRQQAEECGDDIVKKHLQIDALFCSPLIRARETATIIADKINFPANDIIITNELIEVQYGELEGTPWNEYWKQGYTYADLGKFAGAETIEDMQTRAERALATLRQCKAENILVVSHSGFGRALKRVIEARPYTDEFEKVISLPHATVVSLL